MFILLINFNIILLYTVLRPNKFKILLKKELPGEGFDPPTFGLWAQYASAAPPQYE